MTDVRDRGIVRERYVSLSYDGHVSSKWFRPFAFPTVNVHISGFLNIKSHCRDTRV